MIRINQLKLPVWHKEEEIGRKAAGMLHAAPDQIKKISVVRKSLDARKKEEIRYIYTVDIELAGGERAEKKAAARLKRSDITYRAPVSYHPPKPGILDAGGRIAVIGSGPAGLFCTYMLAKQGYEPLLLERGAPVEERVADVDEFWKTGVLNPESNVQFGEGGAGTFSDGKLNTGVKDENGRIRKVLEIFVEHGAPEDILYLSRPHIGTDRLRGVVRAMRDCVIACGGEVRFHACLTDIRIQDGRIRGIVINQTEEIEVGLLVLAIGHSARDTFAMLRKRKLAMQAKAFAVGLRIEHRQDKIGQAQYGDAWDKLPPADYKVTYTAKDGRGVYSFCMCPGGYVVNASSEEGRLVVNGMSNYAREGENANSALVVTVSPEDYAPYAGEEGEPADPAASALIGLEFQRRLEERAYRAGEGKIPVSLYGDFKRHTLSKEAGSVIPSARGGFRFADLHKILPPFLSEDIIEGIEAFGRRIPGFAAEDAVLSGVESRTSSPVRIIRNEEYTAEIAGIYPCGEGAGYAGGITSAAVDGIRVFEAICRKYRPGTREDHGGKAERETE